MAKKDKKEKSYVIKIPVYTTEVFERPNDMFGGVTIPDMLKFITKRVNTFKVDKRTISYENRNKTKNTVINNIDITEHRLGDYPSLLLQISAYSTNLYDGYLEAEEKINIEKHHKLGSDTNFVLICPVIKGMCREKYMHYFLILVYEDPTKTNEEITKIVKAVLNQVLEIPIANIKLPTILTELSEIGVIPELEVKYSSVYNSENDVDVKYREYMVGGKRFIKREDHFKNFPVDKFTELLSEPTEEDYQKRAVKVVIGKKEYRITKDLISEAAEDLKETAEKVFNMRTSITHEELNKNLHELNFIVEKLQPVLENYLSNDINA